MQLTSDPARRGRVRQLHGPGNDLRKRRPHAWNAAPPGPHRRRREPEIRPTSAPQHSQVADRARTQGWSASAPAASMSPPIPSTRHVRHPSGCASPGERRTTPLANDMRAPAAALEGVGILLAMTTPLRTRVYAMTVTVLVCVVDSGACFGFLLDGWAGVAAGAGAASLGAGFGMLVRPRPTGDFRPVRQGRRLCRRDRRRGPVEHRDVRGLGLPTHL